MSMSLLNISNTFLMVESVSQKRLNLLRTGTNAAESEQHDSGGWRGPTEQNPMQSSLKTDMFSHGHGCFDCLYRHKI